MALPLLVSVPEMSSHVSLDRLLPSRKSRRHTFRLLCLGLCRLLSIAVLLGTIAIHPRRAVLLPLLLFLLLLHRLLIFALLLATFAALVAIFIRHLAFFLVFLLFLFLFNIPVPAPASVLVFLLFLRLLMASAPRPAPVLVLLLLLVPGSAPRPAPLLLLPPAAAPRPAPVCSLLVLFPPVLVLQLLHVVKEPIFAIIGLVHSNISRILRDHLFEVAPVGMMINALGLFQKLLEPFLGSLSFLVFLFLIFLLKLRYIIVEVSLTISALFNCLEPLILGLLPRKLRPTALGRHAHLFAEL